MYTYLYHDMEKCSFNQTFGRHLASSEEETRCACRLFLDHNRVPSDGILSHLETPQWLRDISVENYPFKASSQDKDHTLMTQSNVGRMQSAAVDSPGRTGQLEPPGLVPRLEVLAFFSAWTCPIPAPMCTQLQLCHCASFTVWSPVLRAPPQPPREVFSHFLATPQLHLHVLKSVVRRQESC